MNFMQNRYKSAECQKDNFFCTLESEFTLAPLLHIIREQPEMINFCYNVPAAPSIVEM